MDASNAVSLILARYQSSVATAAAARIAEIDPNASVRLMESVSESAEVVERVAADVAKGIGENLDLTV